MYTSFKAFKILQIINISLGLLLCKCCFISVPTLKAWDDHVKSKGHVKLVGQSEFLGKRFYSHDNNFYSGHKPQLFSTIICHQIMS